jgi:hypothetical protein
MNLTLLGFITPSRAMRVVREHAATSNVSDVVSSTPLVRNLALSLRHDGCFTLLKNSTRRACGDVHA